MNTSTGRYSDADFDFGYVACGIGSFSVRSSAIKYWERRGFLVRQSIVRLAGCISKSIEVRLNQIV